MNQLPSQSLPPEQPRGSERFSFKGAVIGGLIAVLSTIGAGEYYLLTHSVEPIVQSNIILSSSSQDLSIIIDIAGFVVGGCFRVFKRFIPSKS